MIYTVCIYQEEYDNIINSFNTREKAIKAFYNYFEDCGINEELYGIETDLNDRDNAIVIYGKDTVEGWKEYYNKRMPVYKEALAALDNFVKDKNIQYAKIGDYGYIQANEVY